MSDYKKIIIKNSPVAGAVPDPNFLDFGEIALNYSDGLLYHKNADFDIVPLKPGNTSEASEPETLVVRDPNGSIYAAGVYTTSESSYGLVSKSIETTGSISSSEFGTYTHEFRNNEDTVSAIERLRGVFVWMYNSFKGRLQTSNITANRNWTLPNQSGTLALIDNGLNQFASTTSAQLAEVINDETGSGPLVFASSPTLTTPTIGMINGSTAATGTLTLNSTSNITKASAGVLMTDGITSTSSTTGSLVVTGGVGVSENIYAGGNVYANNEVLATKSYVDTLAEGLHVHAQVHVILNTPLETITGGSVSYNNGTDGVGAYLTLSNPINFATGLDGDLDLGIDSRIIVNGQSQALRNGIYIITSTTRLTRAEDFNTPAEMAGGDFVFVTHGSTYANTGWVLGEAVTSVGVSPVNFIQFSGAGTPIAGAGLIADGLILSVGGTSGRIIANSDSIDLASSGVTPDTYKSVTVDTYGRVTTGTNPTTLAGYGITDAVSVNTPIDTTITGSGKTFANADNTKIFHITGTNTLILPTWSSIDAGWSIGIVNVGGSVLTVNRSEADTINNALTTFSNSVPYSAVYIYRSPATGSFVAIGMLS